MFRPTGAISTCGEGCIFCDRLDGDDLTVVASVDGLARGTSRFEKAPRRSSGSTDGSGLDSAFEGLVRPREVDRPAEGAGRGWVADSRSSRSRSDPALGNEDDTPSEDRYDDDRCAWLWCDTPSVLRDDPDRADVSLVEDEYELWADSSSWLGSTCANTRASCAWRRALCSSRVGPVTPSC